MDTGMHMHHTAPADGETATDPVCGMTVAVNADAITREYEGKSYYFCGEHCATNFMKAPQVFLCLLYTSCVTLFCKVSRFLATGASVRRMLRPPRPSVLNRKHV